jgi:lysophospholipase L1-like esterase
MNDCIPPHFWVFDCRMATAGTRKRSRVKAGDRGLSGEDAHESAPLVSSRRKVWFRLIAVVLVVLVVWVIPEVVVRIANPRMESFRAIAFGGDPNSEVLFMKDWRRHWKLRPEVDTNFLGVKVQTDRHGFRGESPVPGRRTVLCLGDSTAFGWRVGPADPFPAKLLTRLNDGVPTGGAWNVINAGVPGYSSFQVRLLAEELVPRWKPEVIVLCVGNNEAWPVERSDRRVDDDRTVTGRVAATLSASRFLLWASEKIRDEEPRPFIAPALSTAVPRVSGEEYRENLRAIAQIARESKAKLVLLSPPVNLYWPPMRFKEFTGWEQWQTFYQEIEALTKAGGGQKAIEAVNEAVEGNPESFFALWIKGVVLTDYGDVEGGREVLEQAIEVHAFPENCKRSYRNVVASVATEEKLPLIDVNALFRQHAGKQTPQKLYIDWCHPTPEGHGLVADALFEAIHASGG